MSADNTFLRAKTAGMVVGAAGRFVDKARQEFPTVRTYLFGDRARGLRRPRSPAGAAIFLKSFGGRTERGMPKEFFRLKTPRRLAGLEPRLPEAGRPAGDSVFIVDMPGTGLALRPKRRAARPPGSLRKRKLTRTVASLFLFICHWSKVEGI
ncbi:MAG: hypothetical protein LBO05_05100 [Deltaproteobacteria bacterium]|nr:hypothetical protein [Deltaproteobacteria bacterium]